MPLKESLLRIFRSSTTHGLANILTSEHTAITILWSFFVGIAWVTCIYFIVSNVFAFLEYGIVTNILTKHQTPFQFPAVTFCSKINIHLETEDLKKLALIVRSIEFQSANISFDQKLEKIEIGLLHAYWQINRTRDLKNLLETTITSCRFNGKECPKNSLTAFVDNLDTRSLCYRFNEYRSEDSPSVLSVDRPGKILWSAY